MSEQVPKDPVTLDALKRAVAAVPPLKPGIKAYLYQTLRADAWRVAFEWHVGLIQRHAGLSKELAHLTEWVAIDREEEEGMALIREKLQS